MNEIVATVALGILVALSLVVWLWGTDEG